MPEFPKRFVYLGKEKPVYKVEKTPEEESAAVDKQLSNIANKADQGKATSDELAVLRLNAQLAKEYSTKLTEFQSKADDYSGQTLKLFNNDINTIKYDFNKIKSNIVSPTGISGQESYFLDQNEKVYADKFNALKNNFKNEAVKKLTGVNDYIKNKDAASLKKTAEYLLGPAEGTPMASPYGDARDRVFYNKETFDPASKKAGEYLLKLATTIEAEEHLKKFEKYLDPNNPVKSALDNPEIVRNIGRDLYANQIGSELYNPDVRLATEVRLQGKDDNLIDYKASQLAISALQDLARVNYNNKIAEFSRLKLHADKLGDDTKIKEAEAGVKAAENSINQLRNFDQDNYLKTNFKDTYFSLKDDEEQAARRREGVKYWKDTSPIISGALSILPIDPVKGYYTAKATGKALYNNLLGSASWVEGLINGEAAGAALNNLERFDKTGYTIGIDEEGKPVESSRFHWVDKEGKHHFNGYATVESGIPVAHQMLETIGIGIVAAETGGAALGLLGRIGAGALRYGGTAARYALGAERLTLAGERLAATGGKLLETPYLGRGLKGVGAAAEKTAEVISSPAVLDRLRTFGSVYATTYPRVYMEELNNFKKGEDAQNVARWRAAVESLSESYVPNTPDLFKAGAKSLFPFKAASYAKDLSAGLDGVVLGMAPGISNKLLNRVVNSAITKRALGMAGDVFQEGVIEEEASLIGNHFVDQLAKSKNAEYVAQNDLTWKNIMDTAVESVAAMALTAPFMGGGTKRAREQANTEAIISSRWNIANNPEAYKSYIKSQLDKGEITQEQAVQKVAKIDQYAKALENLPIRNLSSIRDMATLLENKDAQYQFFSNHLKKEALLDYTPSEEELPEYTKELERLDGELYKTQQLASKYDSLSLEDKKEIIYNNYKNKYSNIVDRDDVSPIAITAELLRAQKDLTTKKGRIYSKELEGYVNDLGASMDAVKSKFQSFIKNNNEGLTSEQLQYKYELVNVNKDFFAEEEMEDMFDTLGRVVAATYGPLFEIKDENEFIEALARNYVTADTNKRPLTTNDGELLYGQIQEKYVNDYLFNDFIKDLSKEEAAKKNEELKNRFWTRVVELKQDLQKGQVFPGVANTPLTPEQQEAQQVAKAAEVAPKYKDFVDQYRVAAERSLGEEMLDIQEDAANALVKEDNLEGVIAGLASLQSVFIKENFQKIAEDLRAGKTESLVNFLTENGIAPEVIDNLVSKIAPKAEAKPEVKAEVTEEKPGEKAETAKEKTKAQVEADLKAKKEEIEKKRKATLEDNKYNKPYTEKDFTDFNEEVNQDLLGKYQFDLNSDSLEEQDLIIVNTFQEGIDKINAKYDAELAKVLQQEVEQLGKMMFDFTAEEQRILTEFGAKVPTETTVSPESLFEPVIEPLTFSPEEQAQNEQTQERQDIEQNVIIEDIRPNYVYLGVTDTSIENKTRLTDQNTAFVFNFIDTIDQSVNSADMRSLGYNMVMHSAREILNRAGLDIQPKETFEEYKEQFKVNGISVLPETQIAEFFKNNNYLDRIKLGIVTDKEGKPLLFDKYGTQTTVGTPVITALGQVFGEGKKLDNAFKASMPTEAVIAPLSKFINGRTIDKKPISVKESNNLIMHVGKEETVVVGEKQYNLKPGVIYLKTDNPQVPYRSTYGRLNTKETAEEIITLIEAYNYSKLNPEAPTLPEYFTAMTPQEFIKYVYNYAFIPKNSSDSPWGITPVTLKGERQPKIVRIFNNKNRDVELEKQEIINLLTSGMPGNKPTRANPTREYFEGDFPFRPFTIKGGKVELGKTINFKAWYADFNKSGARIDGVINRNLAFAKQEVRPLSLPPTSPTDETTVFIETIFTPETIEEIVPEVVETPAITIEKAAETPVSDKKADIETAFDYITTRKYKGEDNRLTEVNKVGEDLAKRFVATLKEKGLVKEDYRMAPRTDGSVERMKVNTDAEGNNLGNDWSTAGKFKDEFRKFVDAKLKALEGKPEVTITEAPGKLPNDIKEEFKGKFIYATPGAGKTTLAQGMQGVIDTDILIVEEMKKRHPDFLAKPGESIQDFIFRYVIVNNQKNEINETVYRQIKELTKQGFTVLTGTVEFIKYADIVLTTPMDNPRVVNKFKTEEELKKFASKEAEAIKLSGKPTQPLFNNLEGFLTKSGVFEAPAAKDNLPKRRPPLNTGGKITLERGKQYLNSITEAQNKAAKQWFETVAKRVFGEDRFIIEQFLTNPLAWATWSESGIRLFADANFAELYHESWHEFTQLYFTPKQREALYKTASKVYGKLSQQELEEKIAEDFRQFMLTGKMPESIQKYKDARTTFQKIADFLRNLFSNKKTIDRYFERLAKGKIGKRVGKPGFKILNSAKALSLYDENGKLTPLSYEESKRYLDMVDELFVKLGDKLALEIRQAEIEADPEARRGISYVNTMYNASNIAVVYDEIYNYLADLEEEAIEVGDLVAQQEFSKIFGTANENAKQLFIYHRMNSSLFTEEMTTELDKLNEEDLTDTNLVKDELGTKSQLELAPAIVINLIRSIPKVDSKGQIITNALTDAPEFGDFTENWNILRNTLSGSTTYPEMLNRIEKLADDYPQFNYLLERLPVKITLDSAQELRNKFFNTMSLEKIQGIQGSFTSEGKFNVSYSGTLDVKRVRDQWALRFNTEKGGKFKKPSAVTSNFVLDPSLFEEFPQEPRSPEDVLSFLQAIGFNYSQKAQQAFMEDFNKYRTNVANIYEKLKSATLYSGTEIDNPLKTIMEAHVDKRTRAEVKGKGVDLNKLVEIESKNNLAFANDMIQVADSTQKFITSNPTYQTKIVAALNDSKKYPYFEDLFTDYPELDPSKNWGLENSAYLSYLFDFTQEKLVNGQVKHARNIKEGKPVTLEVVSLDGVTTDGDYLFNKKTIDLNDPEKHLSDIRTLLSRYGRVEENNRIGDKSTTRGLMLSSDEYFLYNKNFYTKDGKFELNPQILNIIYGYLEAEARITTKESVSDNFEKNKFFEGVPQLAYFSEILSPELRTEVFEYFKTNTFEDFENSALKNRVKTAVTTWIHNAAKLSQATLQKFENYKTKEKGTEKTNDLQVSFDELQRYHTLSMISRIEQYKLFNYHPYYYKNAKEVEKRISAPNADGLFPVVDRENLLYTQNSLTTQNVFNNFASQTGIKTLPRKGELEDITYLVIEDERLDSQTAKENKKDYGKHYFNYAETKKKVDVQDAASMFTLDFFRKFYATTKGLTSDMKKELDRQSSIWTNLLAVKLNSKDTAARERLTELLNQTPTYIFSVKKLQYYGPGKAKTEVVPVFHKYANKVLLPSEMVDNEELFNIAVKLHASNADYLVFKTGTKITETVEPVKLYYNGKVDSSAQETGLISLRYLKEQQEIEHKTDALIIFATQFRKLLFKDITEDSEKDLFKQYKNLVSLLTSYDKVKFLEKIENPVKAAEFLVEELSKKNISAITKDLIRIKEETQELEYVIDSLIERTMAEGAISSSIKKSIIRQKFNGSQFVQFPVSLVRPDKKLKFYRIEGGEIASAECMIAFSPKYYSLLNLPFDGKSTIGQFDKEGKIINRYEALKRLNQKLADPAFRKTYRASLTMAGVRIPVQGYNSMEKMEIVEFLPEESGKVILVPDELVVKSGGDFDIDKLFMYEPYLKDGKVLNDANSAREELKNLEKLPEARTKEELEKGAALTKLTLQDYMRKTGFVLGDYESIKALAGKKKKLSALAEIEERKILQNKLLDVIVKRLSQKEIFEDLIEPNNVNDIDRLSQDAPEYLKGDRNKIIKEPGTGRDMWTNIINPHYQLYVYQLAHAVEMVGIAAKANTFQTAAQDAELEIIDQDEIDLIYFDVHKTEDGNIKLWEIYDVKGKNKISQIISQIISGSVDVVKNDNILKINITPETVPVALYMNFMGASFDDIVTLVQDELVYNYSKGESLEEILKGFPEYRALISRDKKGRVLEAQTTTAILKTSAPEDLFIDDSAKGSLMRLAQYIVLENQQNTYLTPLIVGVDYDTQSFQNFEAVTRKERDIKKVKESDFFNPRAVVKLVTQSPVASFRIDDQFIKKFESLFPISANKEIANFILDAYDDRSVNKKRVDYENYSRRFKNALLTSILETNMPEFKKYADYLKVDPNVPNLEDMASEIKKEAAEYDAYIPLLNDVFFTGNIDSNYIAPGIIKNDKEFDVDVKKEQFNQNLNWDAEGKQQVPEEFRQKVRNFFRIFAYTGIISTQLNKAHGSFLEIIPEQIYTPVVDRFVRETAKDLSKGKQSPYLASFLSRFRVNNPDIYPPYGDERIPNPSLKFYRNYNLNATPQEVLAEYPPLVSKAKVASMAPIVEAPVTSVKENPLLKAGVKPTDMLGNAAKDIQMAGESTQFIGYQSGNAAVSSTNKYREAWGSLANTGNYSSTDVIMVSGSGTFRGVTADQIKLTLSSKYKPLLNKAIAAGASFRVGNQYAKGNLSDQLIAEYLQKSGYVEEKLDGYSRWSKPTTPTVSEGIEINSKQIGLGNDLTNVHYATNGKSKFDIKPSDASLTLTPEAKKTWGESVEAWYKSNNAKSKGIPEGTEGDAYDMKLMIGLITDKLKQYPNLVTQITERGGLAFLDKSTHTMGTGRWSSKNPKNMFMNALKQAYRNVSTTPTVTTEVKEPPVPKDVDTLTAENTKTIFDSTAKDTPSDQNIIDKANDIQDDDSICPNP